jgi:hypothetical protein
MAAYLSPVFGAGGQLFNNSGVPLAGGLLYTYVAGSSTTLQATWTDATQGIANANPIVLDASGRPPQEIWLAGGAYYRFVVTDSLGNPVGYTMDNIRGNNDASYTQVNAAEWLLAGTPTYVSATSFTVVGDQTLVMQALRRVKSQVTAGLSYGTIASSSYGAGVTTVIVVNDSTPLDSGMSVLWYSILSATPTSLPATVMNSAAYQAQVPVAFTTGGTSTAYTLTPSPVILGYAANLQFDVTFNSTNGAAPTIAINGLAAIALVKANSAGAYVPLVAGDVNSGWRSNVVLLDATHALVRQVVSTAASTTGRAIAMAMIFGF